MSGRPTAEIVAELRDHLQAGGFLVFGQAADRLTELDDLVSTVTAMVEDGHPDDVEWFAIVCSRLRAVRP